MNVESVFQKLPVDGIASGRVEVVLENPPGKLLGSGTIRLTPNARPEVEIAIEEMDAPPEYQGNLIAFLNATPPTKQGGNLVVRIKASEDERSIVSFDLQTKEGVFSANQGMLLAPVMFGFGAKKTLSLVLHDLTFTTDSSEPARYWMIPLQGPFEDHYFKRSPRHHPVAFGDDDISAFNADGVNCWLQIFDGEKKTAHPLVTYDAIAFGELQNLPKTLDETWDALPTGLMESLSFATGADITAPWIELRAVDGSLVSRLVFALGHRTSPQGFAAFAKVNEFAPNSGISAFLSAFFSLSPPKRQSLIPVLNLLRSGAPGSFTIEESITDLVKALDNLCARYGFTTQDLLSRLDQDNRDKVRDVVNKTRKNFLQIAQDNRLAGRQPQGLVLDEIAGRLSAVTSTSRTFGIAVNDLLNHVGLKDGKMLDQHYGILTNNQMTWSAMLSAVRGEVIHKGFLRIKDRQDLRMWFWFARHLHDLCKRIVLREINYGGQYQASTNPWLGNYAVDRIGDNATLKELGFSQLPTHL